MRGLRVFRNAPFFGQKAQRRWRDTGRTKPEDTRSGSSTDRLRSTRRNRAPESGSSTRTWSTTVLARRTGDASAISTIASSVSETTQALARRMTHRASCVINRRWTRGPRSSASVPELSASDACSLRARAKAHRLRPESQSPSTHRLSPRTLRRSSSLRPVRLPLPPSRRRRVKRHRGSRSSPLPPCLPWESRCASSP
jgi:hypothetical protein